MKEQLGIILRIVAEVMDVQQRDIISPARHILLSDSRSIYIKMASDEFPGAHNSVAITEFIKRDRAGYYHHLEKWNSLYLHNLLFRKKYEECIAKYRQAAPLDVFNSPFYAIPLTL